MDTARSEGRNSAQLKRGQNTKHIQSLLCSWSIALFLFVSRVRISEGIDAHRPRLFPRSKSSSKPGKRVKICGTCKIIHVRSGGLGIGGLGHGGLGRNRVAPLGCQTNDSFPDLVYVERLLGIYPKASPAALKGAAHPRGVIPIRLCGCGAGAPCVDFWMIFEARPRDTSKRNFVRGVFCGLLLVFAITSYFGARRVPNDNANTTKGKDKMENTAGWDHRPSETLSVSRKKVFAFVGVQTGFTEDFNNPQYNYELRREVLRKTWFPGSKTALDEFEKKSGVVVRFVMGHHGDQSREWDIKVEEEKYGEFMRLDLEEGYLESVDKTLLFIKKVLKLYEPEYILKVDDDVYFRLDRVPYAVRQWKAKKSDYVGCMARGPVFTEPGFRWSERQHELIGDNYFTYSWGPAYAMSRRAAEMIASMAPGSLRSLKNEDTSVGVWMLALNVTYFDDRRLCSPQCTDTSLGVYDTPRCSGLCDPLRGIELHTMADCQNPTIPDGFMDLPLMDEVFRVHGVVSRKSRLAP